jgi:uncharacterized protein (DUF58 family)
MALIPEKIFRPRGWLLIAAGLLALLLAAVMGRRDLLVVAIFLIVLPLLASAGLRFFAPGFTVSRRFFPAFVEAGTTAQVTLDVRGSTPGGARARITEDLPAHLVDVPRFDYPNPVAPRSLLSSYSYYLHPSRRGVFTIGPLTARFGDPFDVALLKRKLDDGDPLTVAPAAVVLPEISLTGGRGQDGSRMTRQQANPSDDDVMTREYRHGDPLRRVHWPATARQGKLMVRAEESVTTPEAALVLDQRLWAYGGPGRSMHASDALLSSPSFEWAVVAAVSIAAHLLDRGYTLRVLDDQGGPGFAASASAHEPDREDFAGQSGSLAVAQSLAAVELTARGPRARTSAKAAGDPARSEVRTESRTESQVPLAELLVDKLVQTRRRGPLVAITGLLTIADATVLAAATEAAEGAFALMVCTDTRDAAEPLAVLHRAGWQAVAVAPGTALLDAWSDLDAPIPIPSPTTGQLHTAHANPAHASPTHANTAHPNTAHTLATDGGHP